jgi:putative membrane protein
VSGRALPATTGDERLRGVSVAGLVLVPVLVGVLLAWGLSAPVQNLGRVPAAVVNDDSPVTVNGQTVPLGRELAGTLIGGPAGTGGALDPGADATATPQDLQPNFSWVLTNDDDAAAGLADGTYAAVVTIPPTFSAYGTSISGPAAQAVTATVHVQTTPATAFLDPAVTDVVVQAALRTLNTQLTERYLTNVYQGFNQISSSIGQASQGADQVASGASSVSSGADQLSSGAGQLSTGLNSLDSGATSLASGLGRLDSSVQALPGQTSQLARGSAEVAAGVDAEAAALDRATRELSGVVSTLCQTPGRLCDRGTALLSRLQSASSDIDRLARGADAVAVGNRRLSQSMPALVAGIGQSASGADQVASGAGTSASAGRSLASGAAKLASGAGQVDTGAAQLASGLDQAVQQIPTYTDDDISTLSSVVAQPTVARVDLPPTGTQSIPLFAVVALWVGTAVVALAHRSVARSRLLTGSSSAALAWRAVWPVIAFGTVAGLLVAVPLVPSMDVGLVAGVDFALGCALVGAVFGVVNHGLAALMGGVGRAISVVVAVLALVVGTSSTSPAEIQAAAALAPTGPARTLLLALIGVGPGWGAAIALAVWALVGLGLAFAGTARRRSGAAALA